MGESAAGGRPGMAAAEDDARVMEWEEGLPCADELTPLSQPLITPELAAAFGISPEPTRTILDVHRASHDTLAALRRGKTGEGTAQRKFLSMAQSGAATEREDSEEDDGTLAKEDAATEDESSQKEQKTSGATTGLADEGDSENRQEEDQNVESSARSSKRPRLVWTPQLHKRFVDVIAHLGIKNAVPKTIMQLMNVEGLTRENVASHLQKYRLYLKRMQGLSSEGPSPSDQLFASTPVPQSLHETPAVPVPTSAVPVPMPYPAPPPGLIPMPVYGMAQPGLGGPIRMMPANGSGHYHGFPNHHPYQMFGQLADWPGRNNFGSVASYPNVSPSDK